MRDVFVTEKEIGNPEDYVRNMIEGNIDCFDVTKTEDGCIIEIVTDGLKQRFSFSEA